MDTQMVLGSWAHGHGRPGMKARFDPALTALDAVSEEYLPLGFVPCKLQATAARVRSKKATKDAARARRGRIAS